MSDGTAHSPIFRDFDAEMREASGDPVQFKLGGTIFTCINPVPIGATVVMSRHAVDLMSAAVNPANMTPQQQTAMRRQTNLLWDWVVPEEHEALDTAVAGVVDPSIISSVIEYIVTEATGRFGQGS